MRALSGLLILAVGIGAPLSLSAQDFPCPRPDSLNGYGSVEGTVLDRDTRVPLGFAQIELRVRGRKAPLVTRSSTSGRFHICSVPAGSFTLKAHLVDFETSQGPLVLAPGQAMSLTLGLTTPWKERAVGTLTGTVVDSETGDGVRDAAVSLPGVGQNTLTNALGRFTFASVPPGETELAIKRLGYADTEGTVLIEAGRATQTKVTLATDPIDLDPIVVTAVRRRPEFPDVESFQRRYDSGLGYILLEDEIDRRAPSKVSQLLWDAGVDVSGDGKAIRIHRTGCAPLVYLDDIRMTRDYIGRSFGTGDPMEPLATRTPWPQPDAGPAFDAADAVNLVHPMNVAALEVYRGPAETPGEYIDSSSRCGVILIWTRKGKISGT